MLPGGLQLQLQLCLLPLLLTLQGAGCCAGWGHLAPAGCVRCGLPGFWLQPAYRAVLRRMRVAAAAAAGCGTDVQSQIHPGRRRCGSSCAHHDLSQHQHSHTGTAGVCVHVGLQVCYCFCSSQELPTCPLAHCHLVHTLQVVRGGAWAHSTYVLVYNCAVAFGSAVRCDDRHLSCNTHQKQQQAAQHAH